MRERESNPKGKCASLDTSLRSMLSCYVLLYLLFILLLLLYILGIALSFSLHLRLFPFISVTATLPLTRNMGRQVA